MLDAVPPTRRPSGQRRKRPGKLHADKGYDYARCRAACRKRGIASRIARVGVEPKGRLGRHRWVVEQTLALLKRYRRLAVRYERREDIHQALLTLACCLVCHGRLQERL
jgi:IS5 family transposase